MGSPCWEATGSFDVQLFQPGQEVEPNIPLKKLKDFPSSKPVYLEVTLPDGSASKGQVDAVAITHSFSDFPFAKFTVLNTWTGQVQMKATHEFGASLDVVPGEIAEIKVGGATVLKVTLKIIWRCLTAAGKVDEGSTYQAVVPLRLDGDPSRGLENPVTVQLRLPSGDVVAEASVEPREITLPRRGFKDVPLPEFVAPASAELGLHVTVDSPFPLHVGNVKIHKPAA